MINHPKWHKKHYQKVLESDLKYPIIVTKKDNHKWFVLDGLHRLVKAYVNNQNIIQAKVISKEDLLSVSK